MTNPHIIERLLLLSICLLSGSIAGLAQVRDPKLFELERDYAMRFLKADAHLALAKYYVDHGNPVEAFFISETARRTRFEEKEFNEAFYRVFEGFDNSEAAERTLLAKHKSDPDDLATIDRLADLYISRDNWPAAKRYLMIGIAKKPDEYRFTAGLITVLTTEGKREEAKQLQTAYLQKFPETAAGYAIRAEKLIDTNPTAAKQMLTGAIARFPKDGQLAFDLALAYQRLNDPKTEATFVKAAELSPDSGVVQTWTGRYFFKAKPNNQLALKYYLNAYFLDPHAYETEYVESRIGKIVYQRAAEEFAKRIKAGTPMVNLLSDQDPQVAGLAIEQMAETWSPDYVKPLTDAMGHYDLAVRWGAMQVLKEKVDESFDEQLKVLLSSDDPRKRGLAAYIAVHRWKQGSFGAMKDLLAQEAEIVRFDAVSALMLEGGPEGRQLVLAHVAHEPSASLKKLILSDKSRSE